MLFWFFWVYFIVFHTIRCGLSEGEYVSLGHYEKDDADCIINWLKSNKKITDIGLWGRSMGGVTSILTAAMRKDIKLLIVDSAFSNLRGLCEELALSNYKIPKILLKIAFYFIRRKIQQKGKGEIFNLKLNLI